MFKAAGEVIFKFALFFLVYLHINGEISPGGGFQAGALWAIIIVAYYAIFNKLLISLKWLEITMIFGVLLYIVTGFLGIIFASSFLDYSFFASAKHISQSIGIFVVETWVFLSVSCGISRIYFAFQ